MEDVKLANKIADKVYQNELPTQALIDELSRLLTQIKNVLQPVNKMTEWNNFTDSHKEWMISIDHKIGELNDFLKHEGLFLSVEINGSCMEDWSALKFLREDSGSEITMYHFDGQVCDYFFTTFYREIVCHFKIPAILFMAAAIYYQAKLKNIHLIYDT